MFSQFTLLSNQKYINRCGEKVNEQGRVKQIEGAEKLDRIAERERANSVGGRVTKEQLKILSSAFVKSSKRKVVGFLSSLTHKSWKTNPRFSLTRFENLICLFLLIFSFPHSFLTWSCWWYHHSDIHYLVYQSIKSREHIRRLVVSHVMTGGVDSGWKLFQLRDSTKREREKKKQQAGTKEVERLDWVGRGGCTHKAPKI